MKTFLKTLKWTGIALVLIIVGIVIFVQVSWDKSFDAEMPSISASSDSTVIARGRYLAYGPAHCATCHMPMDKIMHVENTGEELPMIGGWELTIPPGTFRAPNITPDEETGIGNLTDMQIARSLRYSVSHKNKCVFPFMPFQNLSDEDLTAVVSFLRSQEPVKNEVKPSELTFMGKAVMAFGLIQPVGPNGKPVAKHVKEPTAIYGSYLAHSVANCYGCHTERDLKTGKFIGEPFAGGFRFEPDAFSDGYAFVPPNLTPHKGTGIMAEWSEEAFVNRFKGGRVHRGSPMPWGAFSRMDTTDLKALYRFFMSLPPVENKIEQIVIPPAKEA